MENIFIEKDNIAYLHEIEGLFKRKVVSGEYASIDDLLSIIEDLYLELDHVTDEFRKFKSEVDEIGLKEVNPYTEHGISERGFY